MLTSKTNLILVPALLLAFANPGLAQTWNGGGANNNWSTAANWAGGVAPANPTPGAGTADVIFSGSTRLNPNIDTPWNINSLTFSATAGAFNVGGTNQLFLENAGITDNSAATETISAPIKDGVVSTTMSITTAAGGNLIIDSMDWFGVALTVSGSGNTTIVTGTDSGPTASLIKNGSGTLFLTGAEGFTNPATINAGIVNIQNAASLGTTANGTTVNTGGQLQIQGGIAVGAEALTLNSTGVGGTGALLNVSGNNSWAGAVTLGSATTIGSSAGTLTIGGGVTNGGFLLTSAGAGNITLSGIVSGTGGLSQTGAGTLLLTGTNTYTGATTASAGTLQVGNGTSGSISNSSASTVASGATLAFDMANGGSYTDTIANSGTVAGAEGSGITNTLGGVISGTGGVTQSGAGTTVLSVADTYSGATTVNAGTLKITGSVNNTTSVAVNTGGTLLFGANNAINHGATVSLAGGTISMQGLSSSSETMGALTLSGNSVIDFGTGSGNTLTFSTISGLTAGVTLTVKDWTGSVYPPGSTTDTGSLTQDRLLFSSGFSLTAAQLSQISFFNDAGVFLGTGIGIGYGGIPEIAPVPEPSTIFAGLGLLALLVWRHRRQTSEWLQLGG